MEGMVGIAMAVDDRPTTKDTDMVVGIDTVVAVTVTVVGIVTVVVTAMVVAMIVTPAIVTEALVATGVGIIGKVASDTMMGDMAAQGATVTAVATATQRIHTRVTVPTAMLRRVMNEMTAMVDLAVVPRGMGEKTAAADLRGTEGSLSSGSRARLFAWRVVG
mmetsp:Transcript_2171/g.5697  ORF Transcript_2171/g.5697 Transcript_2171/m.5697 type:complete len:162 (-) Transcript_2171:104-589(-)